MPRCKCGQASSYLIWPGINEMRIDFFVRSPSKPKDGWLVQPWTSA